MSSKREGVKKSAKRVTANRINDQVLSPLRRNVSHNIHTLRNPSTSHSSGTQGRRRLRSSTIKSILLSMSDSEDDVQVIEDPSVLTFSSDPLELTINSSIGSVTNSQATNSTSSDGGETTIEINISQDSFLEDCMDNLYPEEIIVDEINDLVQNVEQRETLSSTPDMVIDLTNVRTPRTRRVPVIDLSTTVESEKPKPQSRNIGETASPSRECPVCMDSLDGNDNCATICGHVFCKQCIYNAVRITKRCPNCRKPLTTKKIFPIYL